MNEVGQVKHPTQPSLSVNTASASYMEAWEKKAIANSHLSMGPASRKNGILGPPQREWGAKRR